MCFCSVPYLGTRFSLALDFGFLRHFGRLLCRHVVTGLQSEFWIYIKVVVLSCFLCLTVPQKRFLTVFFIFYFYRKTKHARENPLFNRVGCPFLYMHANNQSHEIIHELKKTFPRGLPWSLAHPRFHSNSLCYHGNSNFFPTQLLESIQKHNHIGILIQ